MPSSLRALVLPLYVKGSAQPLINRSLAHFLGREIGERLPILGQLEAEYLDPTQAELPFSLDHFSPDLAVNLTKDLGPKLNLDAIIYGQLTLSPALAELLLWRLDQDGHIVLEWHGAASRDHALKLCIQAIEVLHTDFELEPSARERVSLEREEITSYQVLCDLALAELLLTEAHKNDVVLERHALLRRAHKDAPLALQVTHRLAKLLVEMERPEEGLELFYELAEAMPDDPKVWLSLCEIALESEDIEGALRGVERALELDPYLLQAHRLRALCLLLLERWDEAHFACAEGRWRFPADRPLRHLYSRTLLERDQQEEAHDLLLELRRDYPNDPGIVRDLGTTQLLNGEMLEGRKNVDLAINLSPRKAPIISEAAHFAFALGLPGRALRLLVEHGSEQEIATFAIASLAILGETSGAEALFTDSLTRFKGLGDIAPLELALSRNDLEAVDLYLDKLRQRTGSLQERVQLANWQFERLLGEDDLDGALSLAASLPSSMQRALVRQLRLRLARDLANGARAQARLRLKVLSEAGASDRSLRRLSAALLVAEGELDQALTLLSPAPEEPADLESARVGLSLLLERDRVPHIQQWLEGYAAHPDTTTSEHAALTALAAAHVGDGEAFTLAFATALEALDESATDCLESTLERYPATQDVAERALNKASERGLSPQLISLYSRLYLATGGLTTAEALLSTIEVSNANERFALGLIRWARGREEDAFQAWHSALDNDPLHLRTRQHLATCLLATGEALAAVEIAETGLLSEPDDLLLHQLVRRCTVEMTRAWFERES